MAVEIVHNGKKDPLDVLYHFEEEEIIQTSPIAYGFPQNTPSKINLFNKTYKPLKLHITSPMHKIPSLKSDCELIIECVFKEIHKLYICTGLIFNNSDDLVFPLEKPNLEIVTTKCKKNHIYQTKGGNYVCVCSNALNVGGEKPEIKTNAKDSYKEIIDADTFDVISIITTTADSQIKKVESKTSNVQFKKMLFEQYHDYSIQEGFHTLDGSGSYMECKLLEEDANNTSEVYEDVAVVPLKTNTYERGMVTFSHFLHFFLVSLGAGIGFPQLLVTLFEKEDFKDPAGKPNSLYYGVAYFSLVCFFLIGLIVMLVGLADPRFTKAQVNDKQIKQGSVLATVGFYLILVHCSFALGMFTFKKFGTLLGEKFADMFHHENLGGSFYNLLDGLK